MRIRWAGAGLVLMTAILGGWAGAQGTATEPKAPACTDANLALRLRAFQAPDSVHVLALEYTNTGETSCQLRQFRRQNGYPVNRPVTPSRETNWLRELPMPATVLAPGASAHSSFRWRTEPDAAEGAAQPQPEQGGFPAQPPGCHEETLRFIVTGTPKGTLVLTSRTLSPRVCGAVEDDTDYHAGLFRPEWKPSQDLAAPLAAMPEVRTAKIVYFEGEWLTVEARLPDRSAGDPACPVLLEEVRDDKGQVRIDEVVNPDPHLPDTAVGAFNPARLPNYGCHMSYPYKGAQNEFKFEVRLDSAMVWVGMGRRTIEVIELAGMSEAGEYRQVASKAVTIEVKSAAGLARRWGKIEKGIRVDLTLDKLEYALGEDVPLHLATEDVDAEGPVVDRPYARTLGASGMSEEPWSLRVVVEDESGRLKPEPVFWAGSVRIEPCPKAYEKGTPVAWERRLAREGLLPKKAGTYRIYAEWSPYRGGEGDCPDWTQGWPEGEGKEPAPLATVVSAPVTIRIGGAEKP